MKGPDSKPVVAGIFYRWNSLKQVPEIMLFQRAQQGPGAGHWEFPGGKLESGESDQQALIRELQEELGLQVQVEEPLGSSQFQGASGQKFELRVYFVQGPVEKIILNEHQAAKWVEPSTYVLDEIALGDRPLMALCFECLQRRFAQRQS